MSSHPRPQPPIEIRLAGPAKAPSGMPPGRLLVLAERIPISLAPVLRDRRGIWIGWPGVMEEVSGAREVLAGGIQEGGFSLRPVPLTEEEKRKACAGFSGEVIGPLFHDMPQECNFDRSYWLAYRQVNRKFARATARALSRAGGEDLVWVQGHLLIHVAAELRRLGVPARTAFFLHVPFPAPDMFLKLPWRDRLFAALLAYRQVGFQTPRDLANFLSCVRVLVPGAEVIPGEDGLWTIRTDRTDMLRAGAFPVGIDVADVAARIASPEVEARAAGLRAQHHGCKLVLGIDPLERSRGIPEKLRAFAGLLARRPEVREKVCLVQIAVPSREQLPRHEALRAEVERMVGEINGRFSRMGWTPVHYLRRALGRDELLARLRAADVALVTPLKAGMDLDAKEYCAANLEEQGALVLSEFSGAATQLGEAALTVNPYSAEATARALWRALRMRDGERTARMRALRAEVARHDVSWWADRFLAALGEAPGTPAGLRRYL